MQPRQRPAQHGEARPRNRGGGIGVVTEAQREGVVLLRRKVECGRRAICVDDDVAGLVEPVGNVGGGEVGQNTQARGEVGAIVEVAHFVLQRLHFCP